MDNPIMNHLQAKYDIARELGITDPREIECQTLAYLQKLLGAKEAKARLIHEVVASEVARITTPPLSKVKETIQEDPYKPFKGFRYNHQYSTKEVAVYGDIVWSGGWSENEEVVIWTATPDVLTRDLVAPGGWVSGRARHHVRWRTELFGEFIFRKRDRDISSNAHPNFFVVEIGWKHFIFEASKVPEGHVVIQGFTCSIGFKRFLPQIER